MLILLLFELLHAQTPPTAFEASLARDTSLLSEESWVQIQGTKYRKIEYSGANYYLKFTDRNAKVAQLFCMPPTGADKEQLVDDQPQKLRRSRAFVKVFNDKCRDVKGNQPISLTLDPALGLTYPRNQD